MAPSKPTIWHIIGDKRAGGSNRFVQQLSESYLQEQFYFVTLRLEAAQARLRQEKPALIIFHYPCAWKYLAALFNFTTNAPLWICDHHYCRGFEQRQVRSRWRFRLLLKLAYGLADGIIAVSQGQRQWMVDAGLVKADKIRVIKPASILTELLTLPPKVPEKPLILGSYGRFAPQKGFDQLLQVMAPLDPKQFQLRLGGYGQDEEKIQTLAANLPQVQLVGSIPQVPDFLAQCDLVIIPSRWEPFGLVCLEAKAAGKPVLVTDVDGLPEQVLAGMGAILPSDQPEQWGAILTHLAEQDLVAWGQRGRATVERAWENCLEQWQSFLSSVAL
ncbi:glycosyltransferase family 4 protein [Synechocystis sp. LKSZ1]|uniref:glycosyltransferase family 4 protein n=1 Tax=Synechocystis sp. LKSZ1 TaxID=3144951 RepID=UPI00336C2F94